MEARAWQAAKVAQVQRGDDLAAPDPVTGRHHRGDRFIGGAQSVCVVDRDDAAHPHRTGEADGAVRRGHHLLAGGTGEVDPAVSGAPLVNRRTEPVENLRR